MHKTHILGFPRLGTKREYKKALEAYWHEKISLAELNRQGEEIRRKNWQLQADAGLDFVTVGDFAWYDHVLNTSLMVDAVPARFRDEKISLDTLFRMARGRAPSGKDVHPCEMTKWFDTNYHYLVPELSRHQAFNLSFTSLFDEIITAQRLGYNPKPVLVGPLSYIWLSRTLDGDFNKLTLATDLCSVYEEILTKLAQMGLEWVQMDEPILVLDLPAEWQQAFRDLYARLHDKGIKILLTSYYGNLGGNFSLVQSLNPHGIHIDATCGDEWRTIAETLPQESVLSLGIINGRNIWRADLSRLLQNLQEAASLHQNTWIASSCSLLHTPVDLESEKNLEIKEWLSFATQKCREIVLLGAGLVNKKEQAIWDASDEAAETRARSERIHKPEVAARLAQITESMMKRNSDYSVRAPLQKGVTALPAFPTTTIGSFPQTPAIRQTRSKFKKGELSTEDYKESIRNEIKETVKIQEQLGLDVLVHGEPERNDMVEYFGELLEGVAVTDMGWVQSYGSRCVKPPIIYGDLVRKEPMTIEWIKYAQSRTDKPVKGMLTGPITILCWSFVRNDMARADVARQIALALREEVLDLEKNGVNIIQIDEPALREGLPLRERDWQDYLAWAVECFRLASCGVQDGTQIHSHMCYSQFNDIIESIASLDADVISIECSRSNMKLLDVFDDFKYPNGIGPGVYDIHSPLVPTKRTMEELLAKACTKIPAERLWVNPDCGLKTRGWKETQQALHNMVQAARSMREAR